MRELVRRFENQIIILTLLLSIALVYRLANIHQTLKGNKSHWGLLVGILKLPFKYDFLFSMVDAGVQS